jgi:heme A synthase
MWSTLVLIAFGAFTRGSGSGYGCKDRWPLCEGGAFGGYLPRFEAEMMIEWTHRWIAMLVGIIAVVLVVAAIRGKHDRRWVVGPAVSALIVVTAQAWLGRMIVKGDLARDLVSLHLGISLIVVAHFVVIAVATGTPRERPATSRSWTSLIGLSAASVYAVMILGSIVHNMYFPGWPLVNNALVPDLSNRFVATHFAHRALTGIVFVLLIVLVVQARTRQRPTAERRLLDAGLAALLVNAGLGAVHVFTRVESSFVVAAHVGVAGLTWVALVAATLVSLGIPRSPSREFVN